LVSLCGDTQSCIVCTIGDPARHERYTLSLHDALPISTLASAGLLARVALAFAACLLALKVAAVELPRPRSVPGGIALLELGAAPDRKSTRLNSSHVKISYAVFCLKKKITVDMIIPENE